MLLLATRRSRTATTDDKIIEGTEKPMYWQHYMEMKLPRLITEEMLKKSVCKQETKTAKTLQ